MPMGESQERGLPRDAKSTTIAGCSNKYKNRLLNPNSTDKSLGRRETVMNAPSMTMATKNSTRGKLAKKGY